MESLEDLQQIFAKNYESVKGRIALACQKSNRNINEIRLIWVSKTHPQNAILAARKLGAFYFGENKVQESLEKFPLLSGSDYELHLIGHLQKNKIRKILPICNAIHSVDTLELLLGIDRVARDLNLNRDVFLQLNTSGEGNKSGFSPANLIETLGRVSALTHVRILGLMTMGPADADPTQTRKCFSVTRELLEKIRTQVNSSQTPENFRNLFKDCKLLSMGMTQDLEIAVEEGSHFLRIGTALFGNRVYTP